MMASQTIKEKFVELQKSKQTPQNSQPKIQRVVDHVRNRTNFENHFSPKLVSFGPIHHDNPNLKTGEEYKLMWAAKYIENTQQIPEDLHKKIADNIDELKGRFRNDVLTLTGNSLQGFECLEEKLSWMLFVDGCSLLHILEKYYLFEPRDMNIKLDQTIIVMTDVLLLENQLPYQVLKLLWKDNNESDLIKSMRKFIIWSGLPRSAMEEEGEGEHSVLITNESQSETPTHLLDLLHKLTLTTSKSKAPVWLGDNAKLGVTQKLSHQIKIWSHWLLTKIKIRSQKNLEEDLVIYTSIEDLRAVGIRVKSGFTHKLTDIDYSEGWFTAKLTIPPIHVDNSTAALFLNLIAYEMCPDFESNYEICSYVAFMDSLIDHPEDVKALRSDGILYTTWSNEDVAKLFNTMGTDLVPNKEEYFILKFKLVDHYRKKYNTWIALGFRTYFNNPWAVIAFLPALTALALTSIQTWFAIHPASNKGG